MQWEDEQRSAPLVRVAKEVVDSILFTTDEPSYRTRAEFAAATWDVALEIIRGMKKAGVFRDASPSVLAAVAADWAAMSKTVYGEMPREVAEFIRRHRAAT
jgi:hypothetical protein